MIFFPSGEISLWESKPTKRKKNIMGDKSPKATSKQASQKHVKATSAQQKKQQAIAAKKSAGKKK
jgi:hypothetical protein